MKDLNIKKSAAHINAVLFPSIKEAFGPVIESLKKLYNSDKMIDILKASAPQEDVLVLERCRIRLMTALCLHKSKDLTYQCDIDEFLLRQYRQDASTFWKLISDANVMTAANEFMTVQLSHLDKLQDPSSAVAKEKCVGETVASLSNDIVRYTEEINTQAFRTWVLNLNAYEDVFAACGYDAFDAQAIQRIREFLYLNARTRTQQLFGLAVSETQSKSSVAAFASIATACGLSLDGSDIAVRRRSLFAKAFQKSHAQKLFDLIVPMADQSVSPLISFIKFALIGYDAAMGEGRISPVARLKSVKQVISKRSLACTCLLASQHAATPQAIAKFIAQYDALWENAVGDEKYNTSMSLEQIQALVQAYIHHHESVKAGIDNARDEIIRCVRNLGHDAVQEYAQDVSIMVQGQPKSPSKSLSVGAHQTEKKPHLLANSSP